MCIRDRASRSFRSSKLRLRGAPDHRNCRRNQGSELEIPETGNEIKILSLRGASPELQILDNVDEIEVRRLRGASDPRSCGVNRSSEASRSPRSPNMLMMSMFGGLAEFQVGHSMQTREQGRGIQPRVSEALRYSRARPNIPAPRPSQDMQK